MHPAPHADQGVNYVTFDLKNDALVLPQPTSYYINNGYTTQAIVTNLHQPRSQVRNSAAGRTSVGRDQEQHLNFNPRLGFAWTPPFAKWGTVIRGGYGEYIYPVPIRNSVRYLTADYPFTAGYSQSYVSAAYAPDGLPNYTAARTADRHRRAEQRERGEHQLR